MARKYNQDLLPNRNGIRKQFFLRIDNGDFCNIKCFRFSLKDRQQEAERASQYVTLHCSDCSHIKIIICEIKGLFFSPSDHIFNNMVCLVSRKI